VRAKSAAHDFKKTALRKGHVGQKTPAATSQPTSEGEQAFLFLEAHSGSHDAHPRSTEARHKR
jgi:hypothetical protein